MLTAGGAGRARATAPCKQEELPSHSKGSQAAHTSERSLEESKVSLIRFLKDMILKINFQNTTHLKKPKKQKHNSRL